jgi:hypothetical protein
MAEHDGYRSDRMPRESEEAHAAFLAYRDMGSIRSLGRVGQELGKSCTILGRWSAKFDWVARCRAWDNHLQAERDKVAAAEARKWERRRQEELEANWQLTQAIRAKAEKMIAWPIQRQETSKDGKTIVIEPTRWSFQTAALMAKTAAEIGAAVLLAVGQDVDAISEVEARAIAEDDPPGQEPIDPVEAALDKTP